MMLQCNGIVKPVPKATEGHVWEIRKTSQGIPFLTDTVRQKWCMAIFQEAASSQPKVYEATDLPDLEVTMQDMQSSEPSQGTNVAPVRAPLPGLTPATGTLNALGNITFLSVEFSEEYRKLIFELIINIENLCFTMIP